MVTGRSGAGPGQVGFPVDDLEFNPELVCRCASPARPGPAEDESNENSSNKKWTLFFGNGPAVALIR